MGLRGGVQTPQTVNPSPPSTSPFERGGPKGVGVWGTPPRRKKIENFECLKWPILTEMTENLEYIVIFFANKAGGYPPCGAERGGPDPPNR